MLTINDMADGEISDEDDEDEEHDDYEELVDSDEEEVVDEDDLLARHRLIVNFINYYKSKD